MCEQTRTSYFVRIRSMAERVVVASVGCSKVSLSFILCYTAPDSNHITESHDDADETSSLVSGPGDLPDHDKSSVYRGHHSHRSDITGVALIKNGAFWKLFIMLGLLCGVGLMTIK